MDTRTKHFFPLVALAAAFLAGGSSGKARADKIPHETPILREASRREVWISQPTLSGAALDARPQVRHAADTAPKRYGEAGNEVKYVFAPTGYDADGKEASAWPPEKVAGLSAFLDQMLPVLSDLYGPPSTSYTLTVVRDLRYTASAIFIPSSDEIHLGDTVTYQLLTHELVHAFRRDRLLSSGTSWQYDSTLNGFEEGFAQAVSYEAMTEFARRFPSFGLVEQIYESSHEWDYDFQNVPELGTTNFWSDSGGMLLYWTRYEVAAAAIAKIEWEHPGFHRAFNAEFYRRLNADPRLTMSRDLVVDIVRTVAPVIEGRPAAQWIDEQHVFDCTDRPGKKVWLQTQHYPTPGDYFIFNRTFFYETFANGSDWTTSNGAGGYVYYHLNGSPGTATLTTSRGDVVWQKALLISPTDNPPAFLGFGSDEVNLTTQATNLPWPGGDPSTYVTSVLPFDLYRLSVQFTAGPTVTHDSYRIIGAPLRNAAGVFGGVVGANGGVISLTHRGSPQGPPVPVVNGVFLARPSWASVPRPATDSVDSDPGIVDVTYVDAAGGTYTDERVIGYGSVYGSQTFLFDVSRMAGGPANGPSTGNPGTGGSGGPAASSFHPLPPCRLFDTRSATGPGAAAPALAAASSRVFSHGGQCGIPMSATSLSVNLTVTDPIAAGSLVAYPGNIPVPVASTVSFRAGQTRANNAMLTLAADGSGTVGIFNDAPGSVNVVVDVNGYFE